MFLNRNETIVYERLDNHDLHKLLDIDYAHKNSFVDKLEMLLPKKNTHENVDILQDVNIP